MKIFGGIYHVLREGQVDESNPAPNALPAGGEADPAPAPEVAEDVIAPEVGDDDLWAGLSDELENGDAEEEVIEPVVPADPAPAPDPEPAPKVAPEADPDPKPVDPVVDDAVVPKVDEIAPADPQPPKKDTPSQDEVDAAVAKQHDELIINLTKRYAMTDDESMQLLTDPKAILPKMQANLFADIYSAVLGAVQENLPQAIAQNTQAATEREGKRQVFYGHWTQLDMKQHGGVVSDIAKVYAGIYPDATEADMIRDVGLQVCSRLGLDPNARGTHEQVHDFDANVIPVIPRKPAAVNGASPDLPAGTNLWEDMAEELDDD